MRRVLLTGMSGTGKSTLVAELAVRGYVAVDADADGWSEWVETAGNPTGANPGHDWLWREERIRELLATDHGDLLFVSGCAENMVKFYDQFDDIILLSAPRQVIIERLANRSNNSYGKRLEEVDRVLAHIDTVEPVLRRSATHEIDTTAPIDAVVSQVLAVFGKEA
jgi:dephospho-CoA kinase